jgi:mono/diheme cytochrome c family protein
MVNKLALPLLFLLSACDGGTGEKDSNPLHLPPQGFVGDSIQGEALYSKNCQICHGAIGGGTKQGPPLVNKIYNPRHHADLAFNLAVKNGVRSHHWKFGDMEPLPDVSPEDVGHIVAYVRELQRNAGIK